MNEKIKEMAEKLSKDETFLVKVAKLNEEYPDIESNKPEFVKLVREYGYDITEEDIDRISNMSESELDTVAGGRMNDDGTTTCGCAFGGGGTADQWQKTCACFIGGGGALTAEGKKRFPELICAMGCAIWGA